MSLAAIWRRRVEARPKVSHLTIVWNRADWNEGNLVWLCHYATWNGLVETHADKIERFKVDGDKVIKCLECTKRAVKFEDYKRHKAMTHFCTTCRRSFPTDGFCPNCNKALTKHWPAR